MQAGSLASNDVMVLTSRITVAGVERAHESWSVARELVGDVPDQVAAGGGIRQATGSITWAADQDVTDGSLNPWNVSTGWVPATGQLVAIYVSDGITSWLQFVGFIDVTSGDIGEGMQSTIVDYIDFLNRSVEHTTVFRRHPPVIEGGSLVWADMAPAYAIDRAARSCGFYATPRMESGVLVSAPLQTSLWPELGRLTESPAPPIRRAAPWGWAMGTIAATYTPHSSIARSSPVQVTLRVAQTHAGTIAADAVYGSTLVRLVINSNRIATARLDGTVVCTLALGAETIVTLLVKAGVWTLKTKAATATGNLAVPAGSDLTAVKLAADANSRVAGLQVSTPTTASEFASLGHVDSFFQESNELAGTMALLPAFTKQPAIDLLTEASKATLAPYWFDETGRLKMVGSDVLVARAPVQTVTTLDDITKLSWSNDRLSVRSKVIVNYRDVAASISRWSSVLLWQGSGETLESGDERAFFATEPADESWTEIGDNTDSSLLAFNRGRGSWAGDYLESDSGVITESTTHAVWTISTVDTKTRLYKVAVGSLPASTHLVIGYSDNPSYAFRFRGKGAPILRGRGKAVWSDAKVTSTIMGPGGFPELVHDAQHWLTQENTNTVLQTRVADFIAEQVSTQRPTITGMEVIYDPRRQLGDVITISSPNYMGVELKALIVGVRNSAGDSFTQSLDVRIITATSTFTTYAAHEAAYSDSLTYEQWRLIYPDTTTYAGFNADPLRGA